MSDPVGTTIKLRRDTTANWAAANPILQLAEPGLDTDLYALKYGDGVTPWNDLPYQGVIPTQLGNLIPEIGNTYTLGNAANPWMSLYVSGNTIYLGNVALTATGNTFLIDGNAVPILGGNVSFENVSATGSVTVAGAVSATGNVTGNYFIGNGSQLTGVTAANVGTLTSLSVTGNIVSGNVNTAGQVSATGTVTGGNIVSVGTISGASASVTGTVTAAAFSGNGAALTSTMTDRGPDLNNWNSMTQMGVYTVNRVSWSGTSNTPLDSQVFVGLVEVLNSTGTALTQVYYPGTVEPGNVKVQWNRTYWGGTWSSWIKIINDDQVVIGGSY